MWGRGEGTHVLGDVSPVPIRKLQGIALRVRQAPPAVFDNFSSKESHDRLSYLETSRSSTLSRITSRNIQWSHAGKTNERSVSFAC